MHKKPKFDTSDKHLYYEYNYDYDYYIFAAVETRLANCKPAFLKSSVKNKTFENVLFLTVLSRLKYNFSIYSININLVNIYPDLSVLHSNIKASYQCI